MISKDFQDILRAFNDHKVKYLAAKSIHTSNRSASPARSYRLLHRPILHNQALHSSELPRIRRNQNQIPGVGLPRDQRVVLTDALVLAFERGANLSSRLRILCGVIEYSNLTAEECC